MRIRWRIVLPIVALITFGTESYISLRMKHQLGIAPRRYYWWASIRLDADPLNKNPVVQDACKSGREDCGWVASYIWVDPGYFIQSLMLFALPAFARGAISVSGLARMGINEVWSFMVLVPLFMLGWFYFIGWLVDRWMFKRRQTTAPKPV
jgi:hypothetical protein